MLRFSVSFSLLFFWSQVHTQITAQRYEYSIQKMGTSFRIIVYARDSLYTQGIIQKCWERLEEVDKTFSDYRSDSEASALSQNSKTGHWQSVSQDMWDVIEFAHGLSLKTNGLYDVTIGPLSKLWRRAIRQFEFPDEPDIAAAKNLVGHDLLELKSDSRSVRLKKAGMQLDFGSIAKGFAVDNLFQILKESGLEQSLVDGGGDIYAGKSPPGKKGWLIKLGSTDTDILLENGAIASSGNTFKYLEHIGQRYSHIVNPHSGVGVINPTVVNVTAPRCMVADALASVICILDPGAAKKLVNSFPRAQIR